MGLNRFKVWLSTAAKWLIHADNWIIRVIFGTIGLLLASAFQEYAEKRLNVGSLPQYLMVFFVLVSVLLIIRYLKRMEEARTFDRNFVENQFTEFRKVENKFDSFLDQVNLTLGQNLELTKQELNQAFLQSSRCTFMQDQDDRLETIAKYVEKAETKIFVLSELSTHDEIKRPSHTLYLNALNTLIEEKVKSNANFEIVRIVVPPSSSNQTPENWLKNATKDTPYEKHIKTLQESRANSRVLSYLLKYPNGPKDVSILLIDDQFLFLQFNENYRLDSLNDLLNGGFLFLGFNKELLFKLQKCFSEMMRNHATAFELIDFS